MKNHIFPESGQGVFTMPPVCYLFIPEATGAKRVAERKGKTQCGNQVGLDTQGDWPLRFVLFPIGS